MSAKSLPALLGVALLLAACASPAAPRDAFYRLEPAASAPLAHVALPGIVEVSRFTAEGLASDRAILYSYRDKPGQVQRYAYQLWVEPPALMLQGQVLNALRQAKAAPTVVTSDLRVPPAYVVEGRLRRFEQIAGSAPAVAVELDLSVIRLHGNSLLLLKTYRVEKPAASEAMPDTVQAFESAVGEVVAHFLDDLSQLPAGQ
jgi:ABC-type uncharacterized transport system auxiliary subunit